MRRSLENRVKNLESKLEVQPKTYHIVDWADGQAEKKIAEIKKSDPNAQIEILKVRWAD